jgi:hypothetical protein
VPSARHQALFAEHLRWRGNWIIGGNAGIVDGDQIRKEIRELLFSWIA